MSKVEEIIGSALLALDHAVPLPHVGPHSIELDGEWSFDEIGAVVIKALEAAGYKIVAEEDWLVLSQSAAMHDSYDD